MLVQPLQVLARAAQTAKMASTGSNGALKKISAGNLKVSKPTWWLESRFHFSFAGYYNPDNMNFGALRVLNDDLVKANAGFGAHPHHDAEIFSYIVDGELSHKDSMGNKEALGRGSVQYLSAGTGIVHSEMNDHQKDTTRFLQVWLTPDKRGVKPQYGSKVFQDRDRRNVLLHLLKGNTPAPEWPHVNDSPADVQIHQDAHVYVSENDAGVKHEIALGPARQAYLVCIEGELTVNGTSLATRDAVEIVNRSDDEPMPVVLETGATGSHFLLIEMRRA